MSKELQPTRKPTTLALTAAIVSALAALWLAAPRPKEPTFDGKPLSYYLDKQTYGELRTERDARDSIRDFGTNAVPSLIAILDARESRFKARVRSLLAGQRLIRFRSAPLVVRQRQAALACAELGPMAAPAIPSLTRFVDHPEIAPAAIAALAMIGPVTFPLLTNALSGGIPAARIEAAGDLRYMLPREQAVSPLLRALRDPLPGVRANAAGSLGFLGRHPHSVVPALLACLGDIDLSVRTSAVQALGWFGPSAHSAIPSLLALQREEDGTVLGQKIAEALKAIDAAVAESRGVR